MRTVKRAPRAPTSGGPPQSPQPPKSSGLPVIIGGCALVALCGAVAAAAGGAWWFYGRQAALEPAVEYILDASPRMALESQGSTRLTVAEGVLAEIVRPAEPSVTAGLRVFGSGALTAACKDTDLVVPLAPATQGTISDRLLGVAPGSGSDAAMGEAMVAAIRDLAATGGPHTLVVVTGGTDSCNPEAGQLIAQEAQKAGIALDLFVVGYQVPNDEADAIKSLIDETPGANYVDAQDASDLKAILTSIQTRVDNQGALSVSDILATARAAETATAVANVTVTDAARIVLDEVVHPDTIDHDAIVFWLPDPVAPTDILAPAPDPGVEPPPPAIPIPDLSWFFWIDDFPAGKFAHPNRYVLVDRASGAVTVHDALWWPTLNGTGLWVDSSDYWNASNWLFSRLDGRPVGPAAAAFGAPGLASAALPKLAAQGTGNGVALVVNGWQFGQPGADSFALDAAHMIAAFNNVKLNTTYLGPSADANPERDGENSIAAISDWFDSQVGQLGGGDTLLVYMSGHGEADAGGNGILAGLGEAQLADLLEPFDADVHVIVILDSSYSGSFLDGLSPHADRLITATDVDLPALFDLDPPNDPNAGTDSGSEFTSGFSEAWEADVNEPSRFDSAIQRSQDEGRPLFDVLAEDAFHGAVEVDAGAINGRTRPRMIPEHQPTPTPSATPTATPTPTPSAASPTPTPTATRRQAPSITKTFTPTFTPPPQPFVNFTADSTSVAVGQCTMLHWQSGNIQSLFLDGQGVAGTGDLQACPRGTTTYTLQANTAAGPLTRQVTISVGAPGAPSIGGVTRSTDLFYDAGGCGLIEVTINAAVQNAAAVDLFYRVISSGGTPTAWFSTAFNNIDGDLWSTTLVIAEMPIETGAVEYYLYASGGNSKDQSTVFSGLSYLSCKP